MATTTENIGLTLTPGSEWATKKYGTFITEMAGQTGTSNLELIDKAVGEDRRAISDLESAVDAIEADIEEINTAIDGVSPEFIIEQNNRTRLKFWLGTTDEYNALSSHAADVWYIITDDNNQEEIDAAMAQIESLLTAHTEDTNNPHKVTLAQLGVTATAAELNVMDGVTATASEINKLDGLTATTTELNYVDGVTSNIQTQLNGKAASSHTHAAGDVTGGTLGITRGGTGATTASAALINLGITATAAELNKLDGVTATTAELNYVDGVTSSIQTQLDAKAASSHTHTAGDVTSGTLGVARGGTGVTSNPLMMTNLASTNAASVFASNPRPGVTGTLPIANGGTGATTAAAALTALGGSGVMLNGTDKVGSVASFYAPTSAGTGGYILSSTGSGEPIWANPDTQHIHQNQSINPAAIELFGSNTHGGYIDFHYGGDMSVDYTSRIIEGATGELHVKIRGDDNDYDVLHTGNMSAASGLVNPNILHNGVFTDPINSRGLTEYTGAGYHIDRWRGGNSSDITYVESGGLRITNNRTGTGLSYFRQYLDSALPAGTYTLSALVTEISGSVIIYMSNSAGAAIPQTLALKVGMNSITATIAENTVVRVQGTTGTGSSITFAGIKLERGKRQTLAEQDASGNWVIIKQPNERSTDIMRCISSVADATDISSHDSYWRHTKVLDTEHTISAAEEASFSLAATPDCCRGYRFRITNTVSGGCSTTYKNAVGSIYLYGGDARYWLHDINTTSSGDIFIDAEIMFVYDADGNPTGFTYKGGGCNESDPDLSYMDVWYNIHNETADIIAINQLLVEFTKSSTYLSYPFTYRVEVWRVD